jgi:hypothetical protein
MTIYSFMQLISALTLRKDTRLRYHGNYLGRMLIIVQKSIVQIESFSIGRIPYARRSAIYRVTLSSTW